jgi:protoporphyrinogen oxidase
MRNVLDEQNARCRVVVLGAGPAGLGAAYRLRLLRRASVTVLERNADVGGLAGSFTLQGIQADYGSHRLHPSCDPAILADIRGFLGADLLDRPRHGRIRLCKRWIHFPLKPLDLLLSLPPAFALGSAGDLVKKAFPFGRNERNGHAESFASVLLRGLGATICRDFYFPYARKIWGREPEELSAIQARRRVKAGSLGKILKKVVSAVPGLKPRGGGRFYYPRGGFGQIVRGFCTAARAQGADVVLGASVEAVNLDAEGGAEVEYTVNGRLCRTAADYVWSTIPVTTLVRCIRPQAPAEVLQACDGIRYRSMILVYLVLSQSHFSEYDAHYFPEADVPITRLSEPKNYSSSVQPADRTVLCAELPCAKGDRYWDMSDVELGALIADALARMGIPITGTVLQVASRRLPQAYPIYQQGYETSFQRIDQWLAELPAVLTLGRQGLFAHDNTHHTLAMAYAAVDCLNVQGRFAGAEWDRCRKIFETHVVED